MIKEDSPIFKRVMQRQLYAMNMSTQTADIFVPGKANLIMDDNRRPVCVGIVSNTWVPQQMSDLCHAFETMVRIDQFKTVDVKDCVSNGGSYVSRDYTIGRADGWVPPSDKLKVGQRFGLVMRLSTGFDGTQSTRIGFGTLDLVCLNGMIAYQNVNAYSKKHTSSAVNIDFVTAMANCEKFFVGEIARINRVASTILRQDDTRWLLSHFGVSDAMIEKLQDRIEVEVANRGQSMFAFESALTYYASHDSDEFPIKLRGHNDNTAVVLHRRQEQVRRWITSDRYNAVIERAA